MLAVAATDSWNPTDHTSAGSSTSRTTTAPARIDPVLLGRPSRTPISASPAITPARITEGSAPVSTTKNATVPIPSANRGHRDHRSAAPSATIGASTIATFSPETTSRCESPVARKSRSRTGSSLESSPSASPISNPASRGGNEDSIERPASARNACAHRTGANGAGPRRVGLVDLQVGRDPAPEQERREAPVLDGSQRSGDADDDRRGPRRAARRGRRAIPSRERPRRPRPSGPNGRPDRRPPIAFGRGIDAERTLDGDRPARGARAPRPAPDARARSPTRSASRTARSSASGSGSHTGRSCRVRRRCHGRPRIAHSTSPARSSDRVSSPAGREGQRRTQQPAAGRQPDPWVDDLADPWLQPAGRPRTRPRAPA